MLSAGTVRSKQRAALETRDAGTPAAAARCQSEASPGHPLVRLLGPPGWRKGPPRRHSRRYEREWWAC
jgi:hypothetical protein